MTVPESSSAEERHTPVPASTPTLSSASRAFEGAERGAPGNAIAVPRLDREHMPTDFSISIAGSGGMDNLLFGPRRGRRQPMRGFEDTYVDIVDYITRITHRIWEERDFGYIYDTYRADAAVNSGGGRKSGREEIVAETIQYSSAFPDLKLLADEVIWAGDEDRGFHTSHRIWETGTNTGWSDWGHPTNKAISHWVVANCLVSENQIYEEWVLDNTAAMFSDLGFDIRELARRSQPNPALEAIPLVVGQVERLQGQGSPHPIEAPADDADDPEAAVRYALHMIWNWRNLSNVDRMYAANIRFHGATNRELYGRGAVKQYVTEMLAMFPDLVHHVDEVYYMGNADAGYRMSVRWSIVGTHTGSGIYGPATGRRMVQWGITQLDVRNGRVVEEWNMFNEFEVLQQLLREDPAEFSA
jgi:hypothetical protein